MGIDVIKAQWAVRITGFRSIPEFATAGEGSWLLNPVMATPLLRVSYRDWQRLLTKGGTRSSAALFDERHIYPGHRQPEVHALAHSGEADDHALIVLHGRRPCTTAHGDAGCQLDILPLEVPQLLQTIDIAHARRLLDPHGHDVEATDFKLMLRPVEQGERP
jgi:hypothetical protein